MGKNGVTIADVAERGGVSKVTVSYVLNGRQTGVRISEGTRQRVFAAAKELGYHPNALARGLARRQTDTLTLVMQYPAVFSGWSGFTNEMMHGASDKASELGFDLMLHTKAQPDLDRDAAALTDGRADGALLLRDRDDPLTERLTERGFPYVQIFSRSDSVETCYVDCDNVAGARMAVEYLWELGHRRIGHLAGSSQSFAASDRWIGYTQALTALSAEVRPEWCCEATYAGSDFTQFCEMMSRPDAPTAIFSWSDDVAIRAIRLLREQLGLSVPNDVAVIGFDGTEVCEHVTPGISSVRQPIYEMAACGVEMLVAQIRHEPILEKHVVFTPTLAVRDSCGGRTKL